MEEVWKAIPDFEGLYEASSMGRIRSLDRLVTGKNGVTKRFSGRVMVLVPMNTGYVTVALSKGGRPVRYLVHRLVALTFIPNPDGLEEVNHKDGVKHHNALSNLEWMSRVRNIRHAMGVGLIQGLGESNPAAKLDDNSVLRVKELLRLTPHPYPGNRGILHKYRMGSCYPTHQPTGCDQHTRIFPTVICIRASTF